MINLEELEKIKKKALEEHIPIIMDDTLEVIKKILEEEKPTNILEIGTAVGYSAIQFARYSEGACVDTIELNEERAKTAKENIKAKPELKQKMDEFEKQDMKLKL